MRFELYIQKNQLDVDIWFALVSRIYKNIGLFDHFSLEVNIDQSQITYYINSAKNLSQLSTQLSPFILKVENELPGDAEELTKFKRIYFLKLKPKENLLKIKEREEFKKNRLLFKVIIKFNKFFGVRYCNILLYFRDGEGRIQRKKYRKFDTTPFNLLSIDFDEAINLKKKTVPIYLKLQKLTGLFEDTMQNAFLEVIGFPYFPKNKAFPLYSLEFNKHSLIVGQTGTGKSKLIELFIKEIIKNNLRDQYSIIILDPHATMYSEFVTESINIDFFRNSCSLFSTISDANVSTELTILLFKTVVRDQFNPKMERVLKYALHVLYQTKQMSLFILQRFLTEIEFRKSILQKLEGGSENIIEFFDTDFVELQTKYYELAIMPIIVLLDELSFLPMAGQDSPNALKNIINDNNITFLSLNKIMLGDKATKLLAGLLIQQIFLTAQAKGFNKKVIFIIDEVSVVENDALSAILSEARKFDLSLFLTQQYLTQVDPGLLKSIMTNVYNYFVFKVAEDDARLLSKNLIMEFSPEIQEDAKSKGFSEEDLKVKMITGLNPRECITRIYYDGNFYPCFKARTLDVNKPTDINVPN